MEREYRLIPNRLTLHRRLRGYRQKEVAALLGLHSALPLRQWEKGRSLPNMPNLVRLSVLYRTYPNELYPDFFREVKAILDAREFRLFERDAL
jgi:transcriptional regulator with XRE-family HTH domain